MALPGLYLPPYIVFRMSQECCFLARNLFFVPVCHLHILTQACTPHAAGRESWLLSQPRGGGWTLGPADPPGGLPSCQFSGQALGIRSQRGIGAVPWGRGTVSLLTRTLIPSSLQGAAPPVCLWGGLLASGRLCTLHLLSLSGSIPRGSGVFRLGVQVPGRLCKSDLAGAGSGAPLPLSRPRRASQSTKGEAGRPR